MFTSSLGVIGTRTLEELHYLDVAILRRHDQRCGAIVPLGVHVGLGGQARFPFFHCPDGCDTISQPNQNRESLVITGRENRARSALSALSTRAYTSLQHRQYLTLGTLLRAVYFDPAARVTTNTSVPTFGTLFRVAGGLYDALTNNAAYVLPM